MKKLVVFIAVFVTIVNQSIFSQIIRIDVSEIRSYHLIDTTNTDIINIIDNVDESLASPVQLSSVTYEFDLTRKQFKYFVRGVLEIEGDIVFTNIGSLYVINFLIDNFDIGMRFNLDLFNEHVTWFSDSGIDKDIYKFTSFQINKGM